MRTERYTVYEVTAAGFDGSSDETDDLVFWVRARTEDEVRRQSPTQVRASVGWSRAQQTQTLTSRFRTSPCSSHLPF